MDSEGVRVQHPDLQSSGAGEGASGSFPKSHVEPAKGCSVTDTPTHLWSCCLVMMITCNSDGADAGCRWQRPLQVQRACGETSEEPQAGAAGGWERGAAVLEVWN